MFKTKILTCFFILTCNLFFYSLVKSQNLVLNPGFENNNNGWFCISNAGTANVFSSDFSIKHSGLSAIKMWNKHDNDTSFIAQIVPVSAGHKYVCDFWVKADSIQYYMLPFVKFRKDSIDVFNSYFCPNGNVADWLKVSSRFTVPDSANNMVLFYHLAGKGVFWMDDVYLAELTDTSYTNFTADISATIGQFKELFSANGIGPGNSGSPNNHIAKFQDLGIDYMRTHDFQYAFDHSVIFPDTSRDPLDPTAYNFHTTDSCIADILNAGGKIYYRFGQSFDMTHTHNKPPYDYGKWAQICLQTIKHYNNGWNNGFNYGLEYFEIWNEPDIKDFWTGTPSDYVKLYRITSRLIKQYDPSLKVGGPTISNVFNEDFTNTFIDSVKTENIPLDFFAYHIYYHFNPWYFKFVNEYTRKKLNDAGLTNVELINSEWNSYLYSFDVPSYYGMDDALNASSLAGAMIYMQSSSIGKFFRYAFDNYLFGMVNWDDEWRYSGLAMKSVKELMSGNQKVLTSGGDSLGTTIIGSDGNGAIKVLITDNSSSSNGYTFSFLNNFNDFYYEIYRIDKDSKFELIESDFFWSSSGKLTQKVKSPYTDLIVFHAIPGIESLIEDEKVYLFPNPAKETIKVAGIENGLLNYSVINSSGSVILEGESVFKNNSIEINISILPKGVYTLKINNCLNLKQALKFIKE